jgi:hypothetical protein
VRYVPTAASYGSAATMTISTNSTTTPTLTVSLAGVNPGDVEGDAEPSLSVLVRTLGYATDVGPQQAHNFVSRSRLPVGDEIITPYFRRSDSTNSVHAVPLARYSGRNPNQQDDFGWTPPDSSGQNRQWVFPADTSTGYTENQKLLPSFVPGGSNDFTPGTPTFGFYGHGICYSDDQFSGPTHEHDFRAFPAKRSDGSVIANTWILAMDALVDPAVKNYDYQELVLLVSNVQPVQPAAPAPGPATTLDFASAISGTIADKDGQGTGFTSVQPNSPGNQYVMGNIDLDAGAGVLKLTSTAGTASQGNNTQQNALRLAFDGTRTNFEVGARVLGPITSINSGYQQQAIFFGPDQDNFIKLEVENSSGAPAITLFFEQNGSGSGTTPIPLPNPASIGTVDLRLVADVANGTIQAAYAVNGGAFTDVSSARAPSNVLRWFSTQAQAGVWTSNEGTSTTFVGTYDRFAVLPR